VQKIVLPSVLVLGLLIIGFSSFQDAYAHPICTVAPLEVNTLYVGSSTGVLHKLHVTDGNSCAVGPMRLTTSDAATSVTCKDIAIDHTDPNGQLYCLAGGTSLHKVARLADTAGAGIGFVDTDFVGTLSDAANSEDLNDANALEIDAAGRAYLAAAGSQDGQFYNVNLGTGAVTKRTDFNALIGGGISFISSGDLARDESTTNHLYWTVLCSGLAGQGAPHECDNIANDRLYRILLNNPGGPDALVPLAELPIGNVFAMDIAQPTLNLCMVSSAGTILETDRDGNQVKPTILTSPTILGFGATGNNIGGTMLMINTMALLIAAGQTNPTWLILLAISGVAVVAYQFKDKIKSKSKKINA